MKIQSIQEMLSRKPLNFPRARMRTCYSRISQEMLISASTQAESQNPGFMTVAVAFHFTTLTSSILSLHLISDRSSVSVSGFILPNGLT
jgi:hypothetical protein